MAAQIGQDTLQTRQSLAVGDKEYDYFSLKAAEKVLGEVSRLPFSLKVLLENLLRTEDGRLTTVEDIRSVSLWLQMRKSDSTIPFRPARVLMQDFSGVPAIIDLAAMRDAIAAIGGNPAKINPLCPVDLVIDHSISVDDAGNMASFNRNVNYEFSRNAERYSLLRWAQKAFNNINVVPPETGICHQINLEYLAKTVCMDADPATGKSVAYFDTLIGTDSHTSMINGLGILGWGVGGLEAEATMLGRPISIKVPEVIGIKLTGKLHRGATATDLALTITQLLHKKVVTNKFIEFYGPGLNTLSLTDRATIANMAPEYGAACCFFPIDAEVIEFLKLSGRDPEHIALVEAYAKAQGVWREPDSSNGHDPLFTETMEINLAGIEISIAGPRNPHDYIQITQAASQFEADLATFNVAASTRRKEAEVRESGYSLKHGAVLIAAITSCASTSNPRLMITAGLLARRALAAGLKAKPWVKTSLSLGSQSVTGYLSRAGLQADLDALGFNLTGYGCATCIGNSGPLPSNIVEAVKQSNLVTCSVSSGNRNFEGRINPHCKANYLASPPLVVAYALAGYMSIDLATQPLGVGSNGNPVFLKDIWPTSRDIDAVIAQNITTDIFKQPYENLFIGSQRWQQIKCEEGITYHWSPDSTYVKAPPMLASIPAAPPALKDIKAARALAIFGDRVTTDQISPSGAIKPNSPAAQYLIRNGVPPIEFNSYGSRRGNHEIMARGAFCSERIMNELSGGVSGSLTRHMPSGELLSIYDAALRYNTEKVPLLIFAGKDYGAGTPRDWAAKSTHMLGVRAIIAESFERIHRSNLVSMGIIPLEFKGGMTRKSLNLSGNETFDLAGISIELAPKLDLMLTVYRRDSIDRYMLLCRIDTEEELEYFKHGGIMPYVVRNLMQRAK
ncbi:MAG: aconitate hydratase AcnA [Alphaproteobacteria bacterium]|nr:aconitate hydratase AcnA [Alphaproteobacteria bacterium]